MVKIELVAAGLSVVLFLGTLILGLYAIISLRRVSEMAKEMKELLMVTTTNSTNIGNLAKIVDELRAMVQNHLMNGRAK